MAAQLLKKERNAYAVERLFTCLRIKEYAEDVIQRKNITDSLPGSIHCSRLIN